MPKPGPSDAPADPDASSGGFHTTHWSVVLAASRDASPGAEAALERLCEIYWLPVYVYIRSLGHHAHDAEDHTQGFFMHLLSNHLAAQADPNRGRFRNFLLSSLRHFLADARLREETAKRGKRRTLLWPHPDQLSSFEAGWHHSPRPPEEAYDYHWALSLAETAFQRLREEFARTGRVEFFDELKDYVWGRQVGAGYRDLAAKFKITEGAVRVTVHRLRRRFGEWLREEVAHTVATPEEIEAEIRYLGQLLAV